MHTVEFDGSCLKAVNFTVVIALLLIAITFLAYLNSFPGAFHFDDYPLLLNGPGMQGGSFPYATFLQHYGGRPLTMLSFYWNHYWFGNEPIWFHLLSVILHAAAVVCVFLLIMRFSAGRFLAFGTALVFALHPLQTQAVNYIWSRSVLLMSVFGLISLLLARRRPVAALIFWQLAMWSRVEAVVLAFFLVWIRPDRWKSAGGLVLINLAAFSYGLAVVRPADLAWNHSDPWGFLLQQGKVIWQYISLVIWPAKLTIDHEFTPAPVWAAMAGFAGLILISYYAYRLRHRAPVPVAGWFWFLAFLLPSMAVPNADFISESRSYLALAGLALMAVWFVDRVRRATGSAWFSALALCLMGVLMLFTMQRNRIWNDDVALWKEAVSRGGSRWRPHYNLGAALARSGKAAEAEGEFQKARRLNGADDFSLAGLGYCAELRSDWAASERYYAQALKLNPSNHYARERLTVLHIASKGLPCRSRVREHPDPPM